MTQTDAEKLQAIILEVSHLNERMAAQTVIVQMRRILWDDTTTNLRGMRLYLKIIAQMARDIAKDPEKWSHEGQYSGALYQFNFREKAMPEVIEDFGKMLNRLQSTYKNSFRIESAQTYLNDVATYALRFVDEINKQMPEERAETMNTCQEMHPQMHAQEKQIILTILEDALKFGYEVSVFDGEEIVLTNGTKMEEIFEAMFSTDMDTLFFSKGGRETPDWVLLIYGNHEAVISDYADTPEMEALLKRADALAETYS